MLGYYENADKLQVRGQELSNSQLFERFEASGVNLLQWLHPLQFQGKSRKERQGTRRLWLLQCLKDDEGGSFELTNEGTAISISYITNFIES